jgi:gamma-tubulin complex component 3
MDRTTCLHSCLHQPWLCCLAPRNPPRKFRPSCNHGGGDLSRTNSKSSVPSKVRTSASKDVSHPNTRLGIPVLPEHLLLRDTLYLLQGISGKYVQFSRESEDKNSVIFVGDPVSYYPMRRHSVSSVQRYRILEPTKALIHQLAEVGHLYTRVDTFVREKEGKSGVGMIEQSLCHHLQTQLTEYYRLVAILESQMGVLDKPTIHRSHPGFTPTNDLPEEETGLTLKRLDVWINDWRLRMRMMSVCVEGAKGIDTRRTRNTDTHGLPVDAYGGALVSIIHSYTDNGDPFVRKFTDQLLEEVCRQFIWNHCHQPD